MGSMRTLRAIYNHARKTHRELPTCNPVDAIDWNGEKRRDTAMGVTDLKVWVVQLASMDNPIRREFHLFTLLSGCRPAALKEVKPEHIDLRRRMLHIPKPKGGSKRAFDIPLSREMILCLSRALRFGRVIYPAESATWVFPANSALGHLVEQKEGREVLSKWGNDLRQSYRTLATMAGVSEFDARLLMNHAIPGVNAGYITRHKLLEITSVVSSRRSAAWFSRRLAMRSPRTTSSIAGLARAPLAVPLLEATPDFSSQSRRSPTVSVRAKVWRSAIAVDNA